MPDHEPPMSPPLPPPHAPPPSASTVANVARHMATAKKSRKKTYLTPDEALDRLLAEHDRKKAKAAKRAVATPDQGMFAIRDQEEDTETQPPGVPATKLKTAKAKTIPVVTTVKTKKTAAGVSGSQRRKKYAA